MPYLYCPLTIAELTAMIEALRAEHRAQLKGADRGE
jgi:hypothetical protein